MIDLNYGFTPEVIEQFKKWDKEHLDSHPICEICKIQPSTQITDLGTIRASCRECNQNIHKEIWEDMKRSQEIDKEYGYVW